MWRCAVLGVIGFIGAILCCMLMLIRSVSNFPFSRVIRMHRVSKAAWRPLERRTLGGARDRLRLRLPKRTLQLSRITLLGRNIQREPGVCP